MALAIRRGGLLGLLGTIAVPGYIAFAGLTVHHDQMSPPAAFDDPVSTAMNGYLSAAALAVTGLLTARYLFRHRGDDSEPG